MSNRLISLIALIIIFGWMYGAYYYFFILNKWNMTITTNIDNYTVQLYNSKLKTTFSTKCLEPVCELIDLAPFQYEMTLSKEGYKDYVKKIAIISWEKIEVKAVLEKQLFMEKVETSQTQDDSDTQKQIEKVRELSFLQKTYKYVLLPEFGYFYFQDNQDGSLSLFWKNGTQSLNLYSFSKIKPVDLDVKLVAQTDNMILILHGEESYIYDLWNNTVEKIFFPQKLDYVKKSWNIYHFVNEKGTFLYDTLSKKMEYFYLFKDFVYYDDEYYLWIISALETQKKKNYNLEAVSGNLIIKYNFKTKTIKVLETTDTTISKMVMENKRLYFYDSSNNKYQVKNIE